MPPISALLDVQVLDLESDRLAERRRTLPERAELKQALVEAASLDQAHAVITEKREGLGRAEHKLGTEVADVAAKAKKEEDLLYSGSVKISKELEALQLEIQLLRERQSEFEEKELELLEEIEQTDAELESNRAEYGRQTDACTTLESLIQSAEVEIDGELGVLAGKRGELVADISAEILTVYERLRKKEQLGGRAAAPMSDGSCGGCMIKLPVMEYERMKNEPEDALISCVQCHRVLVR